MCTSDASETQKGSGVQLASYLGLDIINNVREARDSLYRMTGSSVSLLLDLFASVLFLGPTKYSFITPSVFNS
jgi:hypothetical protein